MSSVYLVDDHPIVMAGLRAVLQSGGHTIAGESADVTHALFGIKRQHPDVILLDLDLGERSGLEILEELQQRGDASRVAVFSLSTRPDSLAQVLQLGALGYIHKSSVAGELLTAVAAVASGRRYVSPILTDAAISGLTSSAPTLRHLTTREQQILVMVARGKSSAAIGSVMHLSSKTIDTYRSRLMAKLELDSVPALVRWAIRCGLIDAED